MKLTDLANSTNYNRRERTPRAEVRGANRQMADRCSSSSPKEILLKKAPVARGCGLIITERRPSRDSVELEIARLGDLTREELIQRWRGTYGRQPPKGISRRLLQLSAAYALQTAALGGLKPCLRKALIAALDQSSESSASGMKRTLDPGSQLVRVWNGRTHHVEVIETGFMWNGESFRSLSAIARKITGARWSGPKFFGL